ncbi:MAG: TIM barrel protein [Candidatus Omnitrophota bacterium]
MHNFCPVPEGLERSKALPDCYSLASLDEGIRKDAVNHTKKTIDTATSFKAKAVVLHCGRVEMPDKTIALIELFKKGLIHSEEYRNLKAQALEEREEKLEPFLNQALKSLAELLGYAKEKGIVLGIENRFYLREIPNFNEIGLFLKTFPNKNIAYWHDAGHAKVQENLGFNYHLEYLKAYYKRMIGMHLHGVEGTVDHLSPLDGEIDFTDLVGFTQKDTLKVIESHKTASPSQLAEAAKYLRGIFNDYD